MYWCCYHHAGSPSPQTKCIQYAMPPKWLFAKFTSIKLIAYDDANSSCYIEMDDAVFEIDYKHMDVPIADEEVLKQLLMSAGKKLWEKDKRP